MTKRYKQFGFTGKAADKAVLCRGLFPERSFKNDVESGWIPG